MSPALVPANGSNGPKQPWMSPALFKSCKKKSKLYKFFLKSPTPQNRLIFNKYHNKFKALKTGQICSIISYAIWIPTWPIYVYGLDGYANQYKRRYEL